MLQKGLKMSQFNKKIRVPILLIFLLSFLHINAQINFEDIENLFLLPRNYVAYQTLSDIKIDGKPDELSWQKAEWTEFFQDIEGDKKPLPTYKTRAKILWDKQNIYILAELEEPHIWAYYNQHDQIVFHENDFEIFIDPNRDTHNYFEFEVNAQNTLFDLFLPKPYRNGGKPDLDWNAGGFKSAVFPNGTINNATDTDKKWTVEIAILFSSLTEENRENIAKNGQIWKMNFSRVQWQTEILEGKYVKVKDPDTDRFLSEDNWVWSQQGVINMHFPERWGLVLFSENQVGTVKLEFHYPKEEILAKYLWKVYYRQQEFKQENGKFAQSLSDLQLNNEIKTETGEVMQLRLVSDQNQFTAFLDCENGLTLSINHEGFFETIKK